MKTEELHTVQAAQRMSENAELSKSANQLAQNILLKKKREKPMFDQLVHSRITTTPELENLLAADFVLGNQTDAETSEYKWMVKLQELEYFCIHPQVESCVQGDYRSFLYNDKSEKISSLTTSERIRIKQSILASISRSSRARMGWQQEMNASVFAVSERRDVSEPAPKKKGLFRR